MSKRIRRDGRIVCGAMFPEGPGDTYLDDRDSYTLAVCWGVMVAEPWEKHRLDGLWWWFDEVPEGREVAPQFHTP
jgi:hypothetical protein